MLIRVNKNTNTHRQPIKYDALLAGTISDVWYDEETHVQKRRNRIKLSAQKPMPEHDA